MKKWLKILFSLNSLRKVFGFQLFFKSFSLNHHLEILDTLEVSRVLVLAPHPDDDIFGCGGTIAKLSQTAEVQVVYFCSGVGGVKVGEKNDQGLSEARKVEVETAGKILGIHKQNFLNYPDGKLSAAPAVIKFVSNLIQEFKPDIIFLPSFLDNHPDHLAVNEIFLKSSANQDLPVWAYEVWTPLFANRIFLINSVLDKKKEAIAAQKSQLETRGYDRAILGLNQYRAEINAKEGFAEAFFVTNTKIYQKLFRLK